MNGRSPEEELIEAYANEHTKSEHHSEKLFGTWDLGLGGRVAAVHSHPLPRLPRGTEFAFSMKTISLPSPYTWDGASRCTYASSFTTPYKVIVMGRSKKQPTPPSPRGSEPTPPRITSNVKQNLQFLRLWKEFQKRKSGQSKPATSYRRKKVQKEDLPEDTEHYRDPTMTLYYTNQGIDTAVPVLLVDGYNVCGYWMKLKKYFMKGRLDISRQKLIDELVTFSMLREVKVVVVFDAMMSGLPTHKENFAGIDVVYSGESCADAWIEKEVVELKEDGCPKVWVATSDHCQQQAAYGAGAFVWSSKALISEIKASQREVERMLQEQRSTSFQGKLLKHNLDSEVVDALKDLKRKLSENESNNQSS